MSSIAVNQQFDPIMSVWLLPQHNQPNCRAANVKNMPPNGQTNNIPPTTNASPQVRQNSPFLIGMQSPSGIHQENPITTASKISVALPTLVFVPLHYYIGPNQLKWNGTQVFAPARLLGYQTMH